MLSPPPLASLPLPRYFLSRQTRFMVTSVTADVNRIAVGDCCDGILFYCYHEEARKFEQLYPDPSQRLVAGCILMDSETAVVSDRKGGIVVLCTTYLEDNASHENNLILSCGYFMAAEVAMSIQKVAVLFLL